MHVSFIARLIKRSNVQQSHFIVVRSGRRRAGKPRNKGTDGQHNKAQKDRKNSKKNGPYIYIKNMAIRITAIYACRISPLACGFPPFVSLQAAELPSGFVTSTRRFVTSTPPPESTVHSPIENIANGGSANGKVYLREGNMHQRGVAVPR